MHLYIYIYTYMISIIYTHTKHYMCIYIYTHNTVYVGVGKTLLKVKAKLALCVGEDLHVQTPQLEPSQPFFAV